MKSCPVPQFPHLQTVGHDPQAVGLPCKDLQ